MTDNVIILGAGASVDAGIPVLANFVEKMWEFALRGTCNGKQLSSEDKKIFEEAVKVKNELDGYHGHAAFNDRNIEDILSLLSFNLLGGKKSDQEKLGWFIKAIARTIELTCNVQHNGNLNKIQSEGADVYKYFWRNLFNRFKDSPDSFPAIITFNYDLVLERALFQTLIGSDYFNPYSTPFPFTGIELCYHYSSDSKLFYKVKNTTYTLRTRDEFKSIDGTKLEKSDVPLQQNHLQIEILKLHGSLNFPKDKKQEIFPTNPAENPHILPPIINKWAGKNEEIMWSVGLQRLREAKNIIIVGYSLPQTDIYMQYFLKAGVGPNVNLNKVFVFNPALLNSDKNNDAMRERFAGCFSSQLRERIEFAPSRYDGKYSGGKFEDFANLIDSYPELFFGGSDTTSERSPVSFL
jgi:hypothetical protein